MTVVYLVSVWLHIMTAIVWVGAGVFLVIAVVPALRKPGVAPHAVVLLNALTSPLRYVGAGALVTFLVTGWFNMHFRFGDELIHSAAFWQSRTGQVMGIKILVFGVICSIAVIHDLWLGPQAGRMAREDPNSERTAKFRRGARICGRLNLLLGLIMVALGILIVRPML